MGQKDQNPIINSNVKELKELTIDELRKGYYFNENEQNYICIFCGEIFEEDIIYTCGGKMMSARKAVMTHVQEVHDGSTAQLISMDKQMNGLSETQKTLLQCMYEQKDIKEIAEEMNISAATVRTHRFNLQKSKREAKILLAIIENIENGSKPISRSLREEEQALDNKNSSEQLFHLNSLHPFFTQVKFR